MNIFPPNLDPKIYNLTSVIIGFALIQNFTALEQNAIGNWFITVGQILENNSAWQQVMEARVQGGGINVNGTNYKTNGNPYSNDSAWYKSPKDIEIENLEKMIKIIFEEIQKIKK